MVTGLLDLSDVAASAAVASIEIAEALDAQPRSAREQASAIMEAQFIARCLRPDKDRPDLERDLKRLSRERVALRRSIGQRGQLGLGCNDVVDTVWRPLADKEVV